MASTNGIPSNFILTPQQQALLFRALASNQPSSASPQQNALSLSPASLTKSPAQGGSGEARDSPLLDYNYDFEADNSFDFDFSGENSAAMIGDLPDASSGKSNQSSKASSKAGSPENENTDKRSHPDDEDDDKEEGSAKRRESEGKVPKKPGRKPLTNEPSSVSGTLDTTGVLPCELF